MKTTLLRSRRFRFAMLVVALIVLVGLTVLTFVDFGVVSLPGANYPIYLCGWRDTGFDSDVWSSADWDVGPLGSRGPGRNNRRARMVNDLIAHHLREGMTKVQVENILGRPMSGGDNFEYYDLLTFPSVDQKIVAWLRWQSSRPVLKLTYCGTTGKEKLRNAKVW